MFNTTNALVLREVKYKEADRILTLLTDKEGKITVKARGAYRKNSKISAATQQLTYSEMTLFGNRGRWTVNEASVKEAFSGLRMDMERLSLGSYFAECIEAFAIEEQPEPGLLQLALNSLYALSKLGEPELKVKAAFELRCACIAGYAPDLIGCHACGNQNPDRFDISEGMLECHRCRGGGGGIRMPVTPGVLEAMRYICLCEPKKLLSFNIGQENLEKLSNLTEAYLTAQLERGFSTLDFYKSLLI